MASDVPDRDFSPPKKFNVLSEGIAVAALTVAVYGIAFAYEAGFAQYFGIPSTLIATSPNVLLTAATSVLFGLLSLSSFTVMMLALIPRRPVGSVGRSLVKIAQAMLILVFALSPDLIHGESWVLVFSLMGFLVIFELTFPLLSQRKTKGYGAKLEAQEENERELHSRTLIGVLSAQSATQPAKGIVAILVTVAFAFNLGSQNAKYKSQYLLFDGKTDEVVLAIYGDVLVSSKFDKESRVLTGALALQKLSDGKPIGLLPAEIGRLTPLSPNKFQVKSDQKEVKQ